MCLDLEGSRDSFPEAPSSPRAAADLHDSIEEKPLQEDKTHIEQVETDVAIEPAALETEVNVDLTADAQEADIQNLLEASDSQADLPDSSATDSATDSKEAPGRTQSMSSEVGASDLFLCQKVQLEFPQLARQVRRFSFLEGAGPRGRGAAGRETAC